MKIIFCTLSLLLGVTNTTIAQGIQFEQGTWTEVLAKAKKENKLIFVDAYTTWCGPCKYLKKKVFPLKEVGKVYNKYLINYALDTEKGEGIAFAKKYKITSYPTLLYLDWQGNLVHWAKGAGDAAKIIEVAHQALNPETQLRTQQKQYEAGNRDNNFLLGYINALYRAQSPYHEVLSAYLAQQGVANWTNASVWKTIENYLQTSISKEFDLILKKRNSFANALGQERVTQFLTQVLSRDLLNVAGAQQEKILNNYQQKIRLVFPPKEAKKMIAQVEYIYYINDKEKALEYARKFLDHTNDEIALLYAALRYSDKYNDEKHLNSALYWINRAIKLKPNNVDNLNAKVRLLVKMKRYKEAYPVAQEVVKVAQKHAKGFVPNAQRQLEEIKAKL